MAVENKKTVGVKIIIGPQAGACRLTGVTICGCEDPDIEKIVINREYFEKEKGRCKKLNPSPGGCCLCTADPTNPGSVAKFCPFIECSSQE
jgi:hypothetical protein